MIEDLFNTTCRIYRLINYTSYDFSTSNEGEVDEAWGIVHRSIPCRVDRARTPTNRRSDGMVEIGDRVLFCGPEIDIRDGDRTKVDEMFYTVVDVMPIYGFSDLHHYEVNIRLIDWVAPEIVTDWEDETDERERNFEFDYESAFPLFLFTPDVGEKITRIRLEFTEAFDDVNTVISIGDNLDQELLMSEEGNRPYEESIFESFPDHISDGTELIQIFATIGTSTMGSGTIFVESTVAT